MLEAFENSTNVNPYSHGLKNKITELIFHSKSGDINLIKLTSKKLYWILVEDMRVPPTAG